MLNWTPEYRQVLNTKKIAVLLSGIWTTRRKSFPAQNSKALTLRELFTRRRLIDNWAEQWPGQPFLYWNFVFKLNILQTDSFSGYEQNFKQRKHFEKANPRH